MDGTIRKLLPRILRSEADSRSVVVMTCGIAGAGKSTFSKALVLAHPNFERLTLDGIVAEKHGIFKADYAPENYPAYLDEAADECATRLTRLLKEGSKDVVFDRAFWNKADRDEAKNLIESLGARWVLVYLKAPDKATLWQRICHRREVEVNADCAYEITQDILDMYWTGFEEPISEGEIVVDTSTPNEATVLHNSLKLVRVSSPSPLTALRVINKIRCIFIFILIFIKPTGHIIFEDVIIATLIVGAQAKYIVPGARWRDTDGNLVNAHAGNVVFDQGTFWLFGEYKTEGQEEGGGVSVYSSNDLATWKSHGIALESIEGHPYLSPSMIIQRPKVVYSEATEQYHMWWHADNSSYGLLLQGLATSDTIAGPYSFVNATAPLGNWSQDFGLFTDYKDGRSYALYSNGDRREGRDVYLTSYNEEVSDLDSVVYRFDKFDLEAPTIIQTEKSYYALMSHKTGYRPNNVVAFRADKLSGPWSQPWIVAPLNTRTFNSQSGYTLRIQGKKKTTYLYLGDQWDSNSLWESRYIWLPLNIDDKKKTLSLEWYDVYDLDVKSGEWSPVQGKAYLGKDATTSGNAFKQEANFASGGTIVTGIYGNDSTVTFHGIKGTGKPQWVSFHYQNTDDMGFGDQPGGSPDRIGGAWQLRRISSVVVNGDTKNVETLYQRDTHKGILLSTPLQLTLKKGRENTITVGGLFNGVDYKGADLDRIVVYPSED
ncbi:hypothetical protein GQX73_g6153 [Xylaria multiplex]|uniref:Glycoside hydrolase family 43 protein n=1 Tax=Xylaria multiplex TaxID=323545 RepID=A0A7C8IN61_9PEZI|nr:hypothetical protein GQX73_g6153 [Xylaria multiplex]